MIGLLLLLMLIGFAFFTFANQEHSSAEYYADSAKGYSVTIPFDWALEQLIIGPHDSNTQSALWPGKHSLVPNMLGMFARNPNDTLTNSYATVPTDRHPYNGGFGINIIRGAAGQTAIDQNFDGTPDASPWLLTLNFSGAAQQSGKGWPQAGSTAANPTQARQAIFNNFPALDVGYTYPDINNAFLAYIAKEPSTGNFVYTPSFHRPLILRDGTGLPNVNWQDDFSGSPTDTTTKVLRPHRSHVCTADGVTPRFLSAAQPVGGSNPHTIQYFGYPSVDLSGNPAPFRVDLNNNGVFGEQGVWSILPGGIPASPEHDVDNDGDGKREGIWLDLNYPMTVLIDGRKMVPLFSYTVVEADGLLNLNTAGNLSWLPPWAPLATPPSTGLKRPFWGQSQGQPATPDPISHSNLGMSSPAEINPFWALVADPRNSGSVTYLSSANTAANGPNSALQQYRGFFGLSNMNSSSLGGTGYDMSWIETANMDMARLLWGCPKYTVTGGSGVPEVFTIDDVIAGRWGDVDYLLQALQTGTPGSSPPSNLALFPQPGIPGFDDDGDFFAGLTDAGYQYTNSFLGYSIPTALGGDPTNYQLPLFNPGHTLKPFTGSIFANAFQLFPSMIGALSNTPFNSPVTLLPFGQPLDYTGAGLWTTAGASNHGQQAYVFQPNLTQPGMYLFYNQYQGSIFSSGVPASPIMPYQMALSASTATPPYLYTSAMLAPYQGLLSNYDTNTNGAFTSTNGVADEPDEAVSLGAYAQASDQFLTIDETAALQVSQSDYTAAIGQSRVRQLASFNFELNLQAAAIRQRFTTASSDRKNHGFAAAVSTTSGANGDRAWEYGNANWDGSTQLAQFPPMVVPANLANPLGMDGKTPAIANNQLTAGQVIAEPFRMELAALIGAKLNNSPNSLAFSPLPQPSAFKTAPYEFHTVGQPVTPWHQQLRLNINRFLTAADPNWAFGTTFQQDQQNPLRFRELTPHPTLAEWSSSAAIGGTLLGQGYPPNPNFPGTASPPFPSVSSGNSFTPGNPALQEYWARRDRQQMARDLYVMLYMFGGGQDAAVNYATAPNQLPSPGNPLSSINFRPVYQDWQLAEMAQFAVNVVDSLDRDDTITMFEYDKDLSNGWNLDDDPITQDASIDRGLVFGVEAQQLAFNEALVIVSRQVKASGIGIDHKATAIDDSQVDHTFTYLELYNVSPYPVPVQNGNWQVVVLDPTTGYPNLPLTPQQVPVPAFTATVPTTQTGVALTALTLFDNNTSSVAPGYPYTIGSRTDIGSDNASGPLPSTFVVDPNWTTATLNPDPNFTNRALTQMVPQYGAGGPSATLNLDLLKPAGGFGSFVLTDYQYNTITGNVVTSAQGAFFDMTMGAGNVTTGAFSLAIPQYVSTFVLRRRLNLNRPAPSITPGNADESDNPFIEVDRITYTNFDSTVVDLGKQAVAPFPGAGLTPVDAYGGPAAGVFFNLRDPNDLSLGGSAFAGSCDIQPKLTRLVSKQRRQPLDGYESSGGSTTPNPSYPTVLPNWPATGAYPPSLTAVPSFLTYFATSRVAYYQNQTVCLSSGDIPSSATPFPVQATNLVFSPNTFGQTSQYLPTQFNGINVNNGSNSAGAPGTPFTLWQPHFDRDFASIGELLSVPLYGPSILTQSVAPKDISSTANNGLNSLASEGPLPAAMGNFYQPLVAQAKMFRPQYPANAGVAPALQNTQFDNRWYRVLELLEVPSRANMQIENTLLSQYPWLFPQALQRSPGKMNLNGLRYGENLFALLDDPGTFNVSPPPLLAPPYIPYNPANGSYVDAYSYYDTLESGSRNWWFQFLQARDQRDITTGLYLPGSPASRPFRPMSHYDNSANLNGLNSVDDTLLRTLPMDVTVPPTILETRGLFEARTKSDLVTAGQANPNSVDYYTRQRLLSKIAGNTTQRSNVFLVWISIGFFEAYQPNPGNPNVIQIGAEMTDQPRRRGFFVVDRSLLEEAWVPDVTTPQNGYYDYNKFIQYRKTLQ